MPSLNRIGKEAVISHPKDAPLRPLEPCTELSYGGEDGSLLVQGDSLTALKALPPKFAGKEKRVYNVKKGSAESPACSKAQNPRLSRFLPLIAE